MTLMDAVKKHDLKHLMTLLEDQSIRNTEINEAFQTACQWGYDDLVDALLKDYRVNPKLSSFKAMEYSFNPAMDSSFGLQQAAYYGHYAVVDLLLNDNRSDISAANFRPITLIIDKAKSSDDYKKILKRMIDHCYDHYINYKEGIQNQDYLQKIEDILKELKSHQEYSQWTSPRY